MANFIGSRRHIKGEVIHGRVRFLRLLRNVSIGYKSRVCDGSGRFELCVKDLERMMGLSKTPPLPLNDLIAELARRLHEEAHVVSYDYISMFYKSVEIVKKAKTLVDSSASQEWQPVETTNMLFSTRLNKLENNLDITGSVFKDVFST